MEFIIKIDEKTNYTRAQKYESKFTYSYLDYFIFKNVNFRTLTTLNPIGSSDHKALEATIIQETKAI